VDKKLTQKKTAVAPLTIKDLALILLSRDAIHKRGYAVMSVCLCVCVSVTFVNSAETNKHSIKIFLPSGSYGILVFPCQNRLCCKLAHVVNGAMECNDQLRDQL